MKLKLPGFLRRSKAPKEAGEPLVLVFIPALVAILRHHEIEKGAPLTEEEVIAIREKSVCMAMPAAAARDLADSRGYEDVDPEDVWNEWQVVRAQLEEAREDGE
jgi:hypothetical protein